MGRTHPHSVQVSSAQARSSDHTPASEHSIFFFIRFSYLPVFYCFYRRENCPIYRDKLGMLRHLLVLERLMR